MIRAFAVVILLCASCSGGEEATKAPAKQQNSGAARPLATAPPEKLVEENSDLLEFTYGWPSEAAAIPRLVAQLETEMARLRTEAKATAKEDKAGRTADYPFNGHYLSKVWKTYGNGRRLLSLGAEASSFTGGAHPNSNYEALLWDRKADAPITVAQLFSDPALAFSTMSKTYCTRLDRERAERREEELPLKGEGFMVECPPLAEQVVVPLDRDDRVFESLLVLIGPYGAGPYAEGSYEVDIEVTDAIKALIRPEFRGDF
jgi:hypothetical protein